MRWTILEPSHNPLTRGDYLRLCAVAQKMAAKYPPDWLERRGILLHGASIMVSLLLGYLLGVFCAFWWAFLVPVVLPPLFSGALPLWLYGREPGRPRWAHPKAVVDPEDVATVCAIVSTLDDRFRAEFCKHCPANNGERLFGIWQVLQFAEFERPR